MHDDPFMTISNLATFCGVSVRPSRSSRPDLFCEKGVLRNFAKFTGKHLCQSLFFNKVAGGACNLPVNFAKFLRTPSFTEHLWWLLLLLASHLSAKVKHKEEFCWKHVSFVEKGQKPIIRSEA